MQGIPHVLMVRGKPQGPGVRIVKIRTGSYFIDCDTDLTRKLSKITF